MGGGRQSSSNFVAARKPQGAFLCAPNKDRGFKGQSIAGYPGRWPDKQHGRPGEYISPQVEYTPPVIFSQENRAKLIFMVEAVFDQPDVNRLHPGQPVEVRLKP